MTVEDYSAADPGMRPRNPGLERTFTEVAARAAGFFAADGSGDTAGLDNFADARAWPSGVRVDCDWREEAKEEVADLRSYCAFGMQEHYEGYLAGDPEAIAQYERFARALPHAIAAWYALR